MCGRVCKQNAHIPDRAPIHTTILFQNPPRCGPVSSPFSVSFSTSWEGTLCAMTSQAGFEELSPTSQPWRPLKFCSTQKGEPTWAWDRAETLIPRMSLLSSNPVSNKGSLETPFCLLQNEGCGSKCSRTMSPLGQRRPSISAEQAFEGSQLIAEKRCLHTWAFHLSLSI